MKKIVKIIGISIVLLVVSFHSFAQLTASATATATIVTMIGLNKQNDMNFGNLAVTSTPGTVQLSPSATPTRTVVGGVTLPGVTGTVQAAFFTVTGMPSYVYTITLPSSNIIQRQSGSEQMTVDVFTSNPTPTGTLNISGNGSFYVGATVHVSSLQTPGVYVSVSPFNVTVNYQ